MKSKAKCPTCGGSGEVWDPNPYGGGNEPGMMPCDTCGGTGYVDDDNDNDDDKQSKD
jgi:DnaJ-class molecular chaperone